MFPFLAHRRRPGESAGFTLIELVVVLAIMGILLALAVPRYVGARKLAYKAEIDNILQEAKTLSWAYYHEFGTLPSVITDIALLMPSGSSWNAPVPSGGGSTGVISWTASGVAGGAPIEPADSCSVTLSNDGSSGEGCNF